MKADHESLLTRIKDDPLDHIGGYSLSLIYPYFIGYEEARRSWQIQPVPRRLSWEEWSAWQRPKVPLSNANLESYCQFLCDTDTDALELYFLLLEAALRENEIPEKCLDFELGGYDEAVHKKSSSLFDLILCEAMRSKPAMYFGNDDWTKSLWSLCSGFIWAEKDFGVVDSDDALKIAEFQTWLDARFPFGEEHHFGKLFHFMGLQSNKMALDSLYENLELFLEGNTPDTPAKWITEAVESVIQREKDGKILKAEAPVPRRSARGDDKSAL